VTLLAAGALHCLGTFNIQHARCEGKAFCGCPAVDVPLYCQHSGRGNQRMDNVWRACFQSRFMSDYLSQTQVVKANHRATGTEVWLIGCMHFNPFSAWASGHVVKQLLEEPRPLAAVVLEMYPERWKRIQEWHPAGTPWRELFDNEMQAASEAATSARLPLLLGDCSDETLDGIAAEQLQATIADFFRFDGWCRIGADLLDGHASNTNTQGRNQGHMAEREPKGVTSMVCGLIAAFMLTLGAPVSFLRTFLVLVLEVRYSQTALLLLLGIVLPSLALFFPVPGFSDTSLFDQVIRDSGVDPVAETAYRASSAVSMLLDATIAIVAFLAALAIAALYRSLLVVVLQKRDSILAESIASACADHGGPGCVVVAVLGQAHCDGVQRELQVL